MSRGDNALLVDMIKMGFDVNKQQTKGDDHSKLTALSIAAIHNYTQIISTLLRQNPNTTTKDQVLYISISIHYIINYIIY